MSGAPSRPLPHASLSRARLAAVQALYQMEFSGVTPAAVVEDVRNGRLPAAEGGPLEGDADLDLFKRLVESVVEHQSAIDTSIARALSEGWRLERVDSVARAILRAGVAELFAGRAPPPVVIGEYVDIAKAFFEGAEPGFVNAALDSCARAMARAAEAGDGV